MKSLMLKLMVAAILTLPGSAMAQSNRLAERVEGLWIFRALFPGQTQPVYTGTGRFLRDGTLSGPPIDQFRGPAEGEWMRVAKGEFIFTFVGNNYDSAGNYSATSKVRGRLTLSEDGMSATGQTKIEILDPTGKVLVSRMATFTGTRVVAEHF